jgi:replicative DNA helicase
MATLEELVAGGDPAPDPTAAVASLVAARLAMPVLEEDDEPGLSALTEAPTAKLSYDEQFQAKLVGLLIFNHEFLRQVSHLLIPSYFENVGLSHLSNLALENYEKHGGAIGLVNIVQRMKEAIVSKQIRGEDVDTVKEALRDAKKAYDESVATEGSTVHKFAADRVVDFARRQAMAQAMLKGVDLLNKGDFTGLEKRLKDALAVGANKSMDGRNYWERIEARCDEHLKVQEYGTIDGITTGYPSFDQLLYHGGWGKKELAVVMGPPKSGKTAFLVGCAANASLAGHNVLYLTLEVSASIIERRLDANLSEIEMMALKASAKLAAAKLAEIRNLRKPGLLEIHEAPAGTFKPAELRALLDSYAAKNITFDLVVVDYADLMAPTFRNNSPIENSRTIYVDLRAIMQEFDVAGLTATQVNRAGAVKAVADMNDVGDDYNKVRTADLLLSLNATDDEKARGEARIYFAASRNQKTGFSVFIKSALERMKFITNIIKVE